MRLYVGQQLARGNTTSRWKLSKSKSVSLWLHSLHHLHHIVPQMQNIMSCGSFLSFVIVLQFRFVIVPFAPNKITSA